MSFSSEWDWVFFDAQKANKDRGNNTGNLIRNEMFAL